MAQVDAGAWDSLCPDDYPFIRHTYLNVLERSGSLGEGSGWSPRHLLVYDADTLVAALPLYAKSHSYGEYVFDHAWARAYHEHGLRYYPKLVTAIPFTPCAGPRLLVKSPDQLAGLLPLVVDAIRQEFGQMGYSGWHLLFPERELSDALEAQGLVQRQGVQFHWFNRGYGCWDDFVAAMSSRKRKNINKERRAVAAQGISATDWQLFYNFYRNTYVKRSGHAGYLTREFFILLGEHFAEHCLLVTAHQHHNPIAAALFFIDSNTIYGRYWGCLAEYDFLHFETCYYQGIDYAIQHNLGRFDGGAQGEHKIARGFEPVVTYSNHGLARGDFQQAVAQFVVAERHSIADYVADAEQYLPFKTVARDE
jgi:predicted N-acyltransferase